MADRAARLPYVFRLLLEGLVDVVGMTPNSGLSSWFSGTSWASSNARSSGLAGGRLIVSWSPGSASGCLAGSTRSRGSGVHRFSRASFRTHSRRSASRGPGVGVEGLREGAHNGVAGHTDHEIAAELIAASLRTCSGGPFDVAAVPWVRYICRIPSAHAAAASGELTIPQVAARLQVGVRAIYHWIQAGRLPSRGPASGRHRIMFSAEVEEACRQIIASSTRTLQMNTRAQTLFATQGV